MTRALITGITGQDGYYLSKLLHEKGYDNAQIGNKYRNTRNAIVNKRTQPQTRTAAAALFPKAWLDAIATRTPRRHNH